MGLYVNMIPYVLFTLEDINYRIPIEQSDRDIV